MRDELKSLKTEHETKINLLNMENNKLKAEVFILNNKIELYKNTEAHKVIQTAHKQQKKKVVRPAEIMDDPRNKAEN